MNDLMFDTVNAGWYVVVRDGFSVEEGEALESDGSGALGKMRKK